MENNDHKLHTTSGAGDEEDDVEDRELPHQRNLSSSIPARKSFMDRQAYWSKFDDDKKKYFHFFEVMSSPVYCTFYCSLLFLPGSRWCQSWRYDENKSRCSG